MDPPPPRPGVRPERVESHAAEHAAEHASDARAWLIPECTATYFHSSGHWLEWTDACGKALRAAERLGDVRGRADMHRGLGRAATLLHRWDEAEEHLATARRLFRESGDRVSEAYVLVNLSAIPELSDRPAEAPALEPEALELFRELDHAHGQARALTASGANYHLLGRHPPACG